MTTKKVKQKPQIRKRIGKTVIQHSQLINKTDIQELTLIAKRYRNVKNYVYSRFSGIQSLLLLPKYKKEIRDVWVKNGFAEQWKLPARYWKLALDEAISNIKSGWSNTKNNVRALVRKNPNLTENEKLYIYYVLKADSMLYAILTRGSFTMPRKLEKLTIRETYVHNLIRRYIRKSKGVVPYTKKETTFTIDKQMYTYSSRNDEHFIEIASTVPRTRIVLKVAEGNVYAGNIRIVPKDYSVELHHFVKMKQEQLWETENVIGIDKGHKTLLATSSERFYGEKLNLLLNKETERLKALNKKRHRLWVQMEKCKQDGDTKKSRKNSQKQFWENQI